MQFVLGCIFRTGVFPPCVAHFAICPGVCNFALVENFGNQQTQSLVFSQNFLQIQKPHRHYFDGCFTSFANPADCRLSQNPHDSADSALDSTNPQNLGENSRISHAVRKSFCSVLLLQKVESLFTLPTLIHQRFCDSAESRF